MYACMSVLLPLFPSFHLFFSSVTEIMVTQQEVALYGRYIVGLLSHQDVR